VFFAIVSKLYNYLEIFEPNIETVRAHIEVASKEAKSAAEVEKWTINLDLISAAKMFRINIIVCELYENSYRWQMYTPDIDSTVIFLIFHKIIVIYKF